MSAIGWVGKGPPRLHRSPRDAESLIHTCCQLHSPLREVGSAWERPTYLRGKCTDITTVKLLGSNFSEKPPFTIGGWGPNGMAGGSKGTGQGWLGDTGILDCNAEFNGTIAGPGLGIINN